MRKSAMLFLCGLMTSCAQSVADDQVPALPSPSPRDDEVVEEVPAIRLPPSAKWRRRAAYAEIRDEIRSEMDAIAGDGTCEQSKDCEALLVGSNACGGHYHFVIFSSHSSSREAFRALATEFAHVDMADSALGRVCVWDIPSPPPPPLMCDKSRCRAVAED